MVINLKDLKQFVHYHHFNMEELHMLNNIRQQGDCQSKIDLKDAYLVIPIWEAISISYVSSETTQNGSSFAFHSTWQVLQEYSPRFQNL